MEDILTVETAINEWWQFREKNSLGNTKAKLMRQKLIDLVSRKRRATHNGPHDGEGDEVPNVATISHRGLDQPESPLVGHPAKLVMEAPRRGLYRPEWSSLAFPRAISSPLVSRTSPSPKIV